MANKRAKDQVFVGIWISDVLADKIEQARGGVARSQFLRDAVADLLASKGYSVGSEKNAPNRVKTVYAPHQASSESMNDMPVDGRDDAKVKPSGPRMLKKLSKP